MNALFSNERGIMSGQPTDSLVQAYHLFRVPESLNHLLNYIMEGKVCFDDGQWQSRGCILPPAKNITI
jgi:hypothetical protein